MKLSMGKKWTIRRQEGFTLFSLAGLVVSSGIALGVAVQGVDLVSDMKKEQFYKDIQRIEGSLWAFKDLMGYWPGDCDRNGLIGMQPYLETPVDEQSAKACLFGGEEATSTALADIHRVGILEDETSSQEMITHSQNGVLEIGYVVEKGQGRNVIVAHDVPVEIASWIDAHVDGVANGEDGRIKRWMPNVSGVAWPDAQAQDTVSISYYFERKI